MTHIWIRAPAVALLVLLQGCAPEQAEESADADRPAFRAVLDHHQFMSWILDPAADVIWGSAGAIITEEGEQDLAPVDDEGWAEVRNAAALIVESGNLLMLPERSEGADWNEFARGMMTIGERAMAAADAQDADALFDVGGQLYNVCVACHQIYDRPEPEEGEGSGH